MTRRAGDANAVSLKKPEAQLSFIHGARLSDPAKILRGAGKQTRFLRLESAATLERQDVEALLASAVADAKLPFPPQGQGEVVIRSVPRSSGHVADHDNCV